ncbi:hypothetical protein JZ751_002645 [Albula glossodonta]|uniref:Prospero domain-containing protein n=1 Tax=Albula glossodonta TaxID=121402 RepID=A0A8T2NF39_9TELE|nr:hypothetical protein JZ751_002645 [Albula glossodonta]
MARPGCGTDVSKATLTGGGQACQEAAEGGVRFQIQEGLSPNHLKKAKLMFFYTRYPSSNMLKMFFSDVKREKVRVKELIAALWGLGPREQAFFGAI